jgi:protein SCO1
MSKPLKFLNISLWIVAALAACSFLALRQLAASRSSAAARAAQPEIEIQNDDSLQPIGDAPRFSLTDQDNHDFSNADLAGHIWICDFIFTTCAGECPMMSKHMQDLQGQLPLDVKLVSISVDPVHDTPAAFRTYAATYNAQPGRWTFLTGQMDKISATMKAFKLYFAPASADQPIVHDPHFMLMDGQGRVRGAYDSTSPGRLDALVRDVQSLEKSR